MTLQPLDLVCSSCGFRVCVAGELLCDSATEQTASFCTLEEYEARHAGAEK